MHTRRAWAFYTECATCHVTNVHTAYTYIRGTRPTVRRSIFYDVVRQSSARLSACALTTKCSRHRPPPRGLVCCGRLFSAQWIATWPSWRDALTALEFGKIFTTYLGLESPFTRPLAGCPIPAVGSARNSPRRVSRMRPARPCHRPRQTSRCRRRRLPQRHSRAHLW
eukprot:scaffold3392_cov131-Isochrysis_galbana.AAC.6